MSLQENSLMQQAIQELLKRWQLDLDIYISTDYSAYSQLEDCISDLEELLTHDLEQE